MYYIPKSFYIAIFIGETLHFRPITTDKHGASSERALLSIIAYLMHYLRGPTPFEDMIFYLWTDSNETCTSYVKLNSKHILFVRIFWFSI